MNNENIDFYIGHYGVNFYVKSVSRQIMDYGVRNFRLLARGKYIQNCCIVSNTLKLYIPNSEVNAEIGAEMLSGGMIPTLTINFKLIFQRYSIFQYLKTFSVLA
jgi:hypothetical protein